MFEGNGHLARFSDECGVFRFLQFDLPDVDFVPGGVGRNGAHKHLSFFPRVQMQGCTLRNGSFSSNGRIVEGYGVPWHFNPAPRVRVLLQAPAVIRQGTDGVRLRGEVRNCGGVAACVVGFDFNLTRRLWQGAPKGIEGLRGGPGHGLRQGGRGCIRALDLPRKGLYHKASIHGGSLMPASKQRRASKADAPATPDAPDATLSLSARDKAQTEHMGAMSLAFLFAFGDAMNSDNRLQKAAEAAKLFLIAVLFIAPVLLMWQHAF